ncbi:MAG: DNA/RNA nuclease SfsA [Clostridiales bacterium]|nr:DNA/RNA nuclease SfsA [Clostridiales bacterium]
MKLYHRLKEARFLSRPNRFIALCEVEGEAAVCHVKNTGRCRELLLPGVAVWLEESRNPARKTRYDLVAVESRGYTVNMDSQAPNLIFAEWARQGGYLPGLTDLKAESVYGASRFDFSFRVGDKQGFVEIKGVTLFDDANMAFFPDVPTQRGVKHIHELIAARQAGYEAGICFVLQREDVVGLAPNDGTDPAFGQALRQAHAAGVRVIAAVCHVTPESCAITHTVPIHL